MAISRRMLLNSAVTAGAGATLVAATGPADAEGFSLAVDATEFGVTANADRDQASELSAAMKAASERGVSLFLRPGTYRTSALESDYPISLLGTPGETTIELEGSGPVLRVTDVSASTLDSITFDGTKAASGDRALVEFTAAENIVVSRCRILNSPDGGLALDRSSGWITRNNISGVADAAIFAIDSTGLEISANHIHDCDNNGILVWRYEAGEDGTLVTNNRIERIGAKAGGSGQNGNGVNVYKAGGTVVSNNRITDCAFSAVRWNTGSSCQIIGNSCARLGEVALYAEFAFEGAVISQNIVEGAASGISMTNFNEGGRLATCSGNIVRDLFIREGEEDIRGVGISAEADTLIEGNVVENAPTQGIALGWYHHLRNVSVTGNILRNCNVGIGVSVTHGAGRALIANNLISGSPSGALVGLEGDRPVTGELAGGLADLPANITASGNAIA
jgi:uncharacterized secreted repeat protein (TIGR03808 family)